MTPHPKLTAAQLRALKREMPSEYAHHHYVWILCDLLYSLIAEVESHRAAARRGQRTRRTGKTPLRGVKGRKGDKT